eukprot:82546-Chlamydomonas_euryale.AAC.7
MLRRAITPLAQIIKDCAGLSDGAVQIRRNLPGLFSCHNGQLLWLFFGVWGRVVVRIRQYCTIRAVSIVRRLVP